MRSKPSFIRHVQPSVFTLNLRYQQRTWSCLSMSDKQDVATQSNPPSTAPGKTIIVLSFCPLICQKLVSYQHCLLILARVF